MGLRVRLALWIALLIAGIALVAGAGIVGLFGLRARLESTRREDARLRGVYEIGHRAAMARQMLRADAADRGDIVRQLEGALSACASLSRDASAGDAADAPAVEGIRAALETIRAEAGGAAPPGADRVNDVLARVASLATAINVRIHEDQRAGQAQLRATIALVVAFSALVVAAAVVAGFRQHRSVMRPIRSLERASERMREGDLRHRAEELGDMEFRRLAARFNEMAEELERLYDSMKRQIEMKSRQLMRSEELAAVGQLAAGVAHEINNPLGIIAGYAEAAQRRLARHASGDGADEELGRSLAIVVEEAFRCRVITDGLLSMARPSEPTGAVDAGAIAERVASVLGGLPRFGGRRLSVAIDAKERLTVVADAGELTQVVTNLLVNAMEAVGETGGSVRIALARESDWVRLRVEDDGRGVSAERLRRLFEPFYTDKPGRGEQGAGLGLAVSHALVQRMGGRIDAASAGVGRGCTVTVDLPAAGAHIAHEEVAAHA